MHAPAKPMHELILGGAKSGKSRAAEVIWRAFGNPGTYIEPFFGSGAVLLGRHGKDFGVETINDAGWSWTTGDVALADRALITSRTAGVMITWSAVDPTATLGHLIATNGTYEVVGQENIKNLRFIREASADAVVTVTLSKY